MQYFDKAESKCVKNWLCACVHLKTIKLHIVGNFTTCFQTIPIKHLLLFKLVFYVVTMCVMTHSFKSAEGWLWWHTVTSYQIHYAV